MKIVNRSPGNDGSKATVPAPSSLPLPATLLDRLGIDRSDAHEALRRPKRDIGGLRSRRGGQKSAQSTSPRGAQADPELVDEKAAAHFLKCSISTVRRTRKAKEVPFYKVGNRVLYDMHDLRQYLARQRVDAAW